jgi:uncharacterized repeat protein (TIGR01451 family)
MKRILSFLALAAALIISKNSIAQSGGSSSCNVLPGICNNGIYSLGNNGGQAATINPGNNYGCLGSQPNPNWFFFRVTQGGSLNFTISGSFDIDFILYGPFTSLASAYAQCGTYGTAGGAPIVDCSYSTAAVEPVTVANSTVGEYYIILITNFSGQTQTYQFSQTGGTGTIACSGGSTISGTVYGDYNQDCVLDATDVRMPQRIVKSLPYNFYCVTDTIGNYTIPADSGTTDIEQIIPAWMQPLVTQLCPAPPNNLSVYIPDDSTFITGADFSNSVIPCPVLEINLTTSIRRLCFPGFTHIDYCNVGFGDTNNVMVYVDMPDYVYVTGSSVPYTVDVNGNLVFNIGTLAAGDCGTIHITDSSVCNVQLLGLAQCTAAWITPGNICLDNLDPGTSTWDHSSVMVEGECVDDSLACFTITNTGDAGSGDMQGTSEYRIYENNILVFTGTFQLTGQDSIILCWPTNGNTIRLEADQRPGHPGNSHPQESIEACGTNASGQFTTGMITQAPMDDAGLTVDEDCRILVASYDPNEKHVSPEGFGPTHIVEPGQRLEYDIHFQNTGNDTAFNIMVVDTLSQYVDLETFQAAGSSHPYTLNIVQVNGKIVLEFHFYNILLPDSTTNLEGSQGYFEYSIEPYANIPLGTEIHNYAQIYFDFNPPVFTNDSWITIDVYDPVADGVEEVSIENDVTVYPNPTTGLISIATAGNVQVESIEIYDIYGKLITTKIIESSTPSIDFSGYEKGIYFVTIKTANGEVTKKIMRN